MKTFFWKSAAFLAFMVSAFSPASANDARAQLRSAPTAISPVANALLDALEHQSRADIKTNINALIACGETDLVLAILSDPLQMAKQESSIALSNIKTKKVAQALVDCYKKLHYGLIGGYEENFDLKQSQKTLQLSLEKVIGKAPNASMTLPQKATFFEEAINDLAN